MLYSSVQLKNDMFILVFFLKGHHARFPILGKTISLRLLIP